MDRWNTFVPRLCTTVRENPYGVRDMVQKYYDTCAAVYDRELNENDKDGRPYRDPEMIASIAAELFPNKSVRLLDIGAGTGLLGKELQRRGFQTIDAIDPNEAMLNEAKKTEVYEEIYMDYVAKNKLKIANDTYDGVLGCSCFIPGHVSAEAFDELHRITKPGGNVIIVSNERYYGEKADFYLENLEEKVKDFEERGMWKIMSSTLEPFFGEYKAAVFVVRNN